MFSPTSGTAAGTGSPKRTGSRDCSGNCGTSFLVWLIPPTQADHILRLFPEFSSVEEYLRSCKESIRRISRANAVLREIGPLRQVFMGGAPLWAHTETVKNQWHSYHCAVMDRGELDDDLGIEDYQRLEPWDNAFAAALTTKICRYPAKEKNTYEQALELYHYGSGMLRGICEQGGEAEVEAATVRTDLRQLGTVLLGVHIGNAFLVQLGDTVWRGCSVTNYNLDNVARHCGQAIIWGKYEPKETQ
jgi:hypothetical protein